MSERAVFLQIFLGGALLGGADDLLQLVTDKKLPKLLQHAKGKTALPQELQALVNDAVRASHASTDAAFIPSGMATDKYTHLQQLATSLQKAADDIQW